VGLLVLAFSAVAERRSSIVAPGHLEHSRMTTDLAHPQRGPEWVVRRGQIGFEGFKRDLAECGLLLIGKVSPAQLELGKRLKRCHK
jgi:hypothetical protein